MRWERLCTRPSLHSLHTDSYQPVTATKQQPSLRVTQDGVTPCIRQTDNFCVMSPTPELIQIGQVQIRFLVDPATVNQSLAMFEAIIPAGARVPAPHSHRAFDETIYGVEGTCTFALGGQKRSVGPGASLFIPRGVVHSFINETAGLARFLAVITPGILGPQYFREVGAVFAAGGPPDLKVIGAIMDRHGLQPA